LTRGVHLSTYPICVYFKRHGSSKNDIRSVAQTYITPDELATRTHHDVGTIHSRLMTAVLLEGASYFRPFGGRTALFIPGMTP
jgi:hypothetical protein